MAALVLPSNSCATSGGPGDGVATASTVPRRAPVTVAAITPLPPVAELTDATTFTLADVQRIVSAIEAVEDGAVREFMAAEGPTARWDAMVRDLYTGVELDQVQGEFGRRAAEGRFNPEGRGPTSRVLEWIDRTPGCMAVWVERTWAAWRTHTARWQLRMWHRPPQGVNPTSWVIDAAQHEDTGQTWGPQGACGD